MKNNLLLLFAIFYFSFSSCKSDLEHEKQNLLLKGLEQSTAFSEDFLNFYFESNIQRSEAEYPDYYRIVAKNMRSLWNVYQEFEQIYSDSLLQKKYTILQIQQSYTKTITTLNTMYSKNDTLHLPLNFDKKLNKKELLTLCKNDLQNAKNIFLRKQIASLAREIQRKHSFAFQVLESFTKTEGNSLELHLFFSENTPIYTHQVIIDSIVNQDIDSKSTFSVDTSSIFGKFDILTTQKGLHTIYGKVKIEGKKGFALIPFKEKFQIY